MSKQALIKKAELQLVVEDIYQAIETIKQIQQQWREIGFAGSHQESKLWQKFRVINDQVFAKRDQVKSQQQAQLDELSVSFTQTFEQIKEGVAKSDSDQKTLNHAKDQASELLDQVLANKPVLKSAASAIEYFIKETEQKIEQCALEKANVSWQSLFSLLNKLAQNPIDFTVEKLKDEPEHKQLTSFWKKRLVEQCSLTTQVSNDVRAEKTLVLEIFAQVDSPAEFAAQRMAVQVSLIQEQMQSNIDIDLTQSFVDWLRLGKLEAGDSALLARIEKIFIC